LFLRDIGEPCLVDRDITKDDLVINFIDVSTKLGKTPTKSDMNKEGRYSVSTYESHFGSWNKFLISQGAKPNKRHLIPKEEFIREYKKVKAKLGKVPTKQEFDKCSDLSSNSFRRIWGSWSNFLKEQGEKTRDVSSQELIEEYQKLKVYLGKETLTQADMNDKGRFSSTTYERRFGSWNKFLQSIGESPNIRTGITQDDLLKDYVRISTLLNKNELSVSDIKRHSQFSLSSFLKKFGTWNKFKIQALKLLST
jgi:3-methyladenine DNA glycosylase Tag